MRKELDGFAAIARSCKGGRITIEEFAKFLKVPVKPALEELFALFDRVRNVNKKYNYNLLQSKAQTNILSPASRTETAPSTSGSMLLE